MTTDSSTQPDTLTAVERAEIDASVSGPALLFFGSSIFWLLFGSVFEVISSIQLVYPGFCDGLSFLTYGRNTQVAASVFAYGFATPAAIGMGLWLTARLCKVPFQHYRLLVSAGIVWNLGILIGACAIIAGDSTSMPMLNFPGYVFAFLLIAYALIAVWGIITFSQRQPGTLFVSQWFLFAGFLCFPWLVATATILLISNPVEAPAQPAIAYWSYSGFFNLWLVPMGLAAAFYIIPKTIGQAIHSYHLSLLGFWTLLLFGAWAGTSNLIAGPLPAWMVSVGVVASVMMLIPALSVALNLHLTLSGHYAPVGWSPALRFVVVGVSCLFAYWVAISLISIPAVNAVTNFSDINRGIYKLGYYGFFAFTAFGAIYYITPRLTGNEWPCGGGINWHFWLASSGLAFVAISLLLGGLIQAYALQEPIVTFRSSLELAWPFRFLAAIGSILLCAAAAVFAMNFAGTLIDTRQRTKPALLAEREEPSHEPVAV